MNMGKFEELVRGLALAAGISAGCEGRNSPTPTTTTTTAPIPGPGYGDPSVEGSLTHLRALEVFEVGQLILNLPDQASGCYGLPCPAGVVQTIAAAEQARQSPRLARLTALAENAARATTVSGVAPAEVADDLQALRDLRIVEVGALITVAPVAQANCYNLPCADDIARADAENQRRAGIVRVLSATAADEVL